MPELPMRPDLEQLRHQAREIQRATEPRPTLSQAQLALARAYGFASWPRLKAEVDLRRALFERAGDLVEVRPVASEDELRRTHQVISAQFPPCRYPPSHGIELLLRRLQEDRGLTVLAEARGRIVGGALGVRLGPDLKIVPIALLPEVRGHGIGTRMMEMLEREAIRRGLGSIYMGAASEAARNFYWRLGFAGRRTLMEKSLPTVPVGAEARRARLDELRQRRARRLAG